MLKLLQIKNFALMDELTITFNNGLTIITGETGAGKSMIVEAIATLCGERIEDISIRTGTSWAEITGVFKPTKETLKIMAEAGIEIADESDSFKEGQAELIIRRRLERGKRQISFVNDQIVSLGKLKEITREMVDLVGQYENQSLFYPKKHLAILDSYAGTKDLKSKYQENYQKYLRLKGRLQELLDNRHQQNERRDFLKYEIDEIEKIAPQPNEEESLEDEKALLSSSEKRASLSSQAIADLYESENSVYSQLARIKRALDEMAGLDDSLKGLNQRLDGVIANLDDIYHELADYQRRIEFSEERLDYVLARLEAIRRLKKRYGKTITEIMAYLEQAKKELSRFETNEEMIEQTSTELARIERLVQEQAEQLSALRKTAAIGLRKKILSAIMQLGMEKADFEVVFRPAELGADGKDEIEFYISTNPGEELKSLCKVGSGGEISRITLALKAILAEADRIPTIIFDEVDTGIGGRVAEAVGELLLAVSKQHQIICITHLPQISVFGNEHMLIKKEVEGKQTWIKVVKLDPEMRKLEIARMLGGKEITKKTLEHAAEILKKRDKKDRAC